MNYTPIPNTSLYNPLYIQYVEDFKKEPYFFYDLKYPVLHNVKNSYFQAKETILSNLNKAIYSSVYAFKDGVFEESQQMNDTTDDDETYQVTSDYSITFNKNQVLSLILQLKAYEDESILYNELYNYNIDLLTGKQLILEDIFRSDVDYQRIINDYINHMIKQNPELYYPDMIVDIPEDQAFYLTDVGIVIYFGIDEISSKEVGLDKFLLEFSKFESFINPRFYNASKSPRRSLSRNNPKHKNHRYYY